MELVQPGIEHLPSYVSALTRGWSPSSVRPEVALEELRRIESDPTGFLAEMDDPLGLRPPVTLPDGTRVPRIPGIMRWIWDGGFCGSIGLRWQPDTTDLPPTCLGHIGYAVVPWKQRRGYATQALRDVLPMAKSRGLAFVELTTDPDNSASQHVIEANGGVRLADFTKPDAYGGGVSRLYRIDIT